jgi:hypothetical protein
VLTALGSPRLFNIGLGRPATIQEHEVTATLPTVASGAEFGPWVANPEVETLAVPPSSHIISNCRATIELFQITAPALDEVYVDFAPHASHPFASF